MAQQAQQWRSGHGESAWLSMLVDTMENVSRPEFCSIPCDPAVIEAVRIHLASPVAPRGLHGSKFSLRN